MALIPLKLPAGVYRNGTDFEGAGHWRDSNLIRWKEGSLRPVGGWETRKASAFAAAPRGMHTWLDNSGDYHIAAGTYNKLYHLNPSTDAVVDITPVGFTAGAEDASENIGYGGSTYGTDLYGVTRPSTGIIDTPATTWDLDNWGEYLLACSDADGKIYEWQLDSSTPTPAAVVANAPTSCLGMIVTDERFVMAFGAGGNPRKVQWCDRENNTVWTPAATNEAGDYELQTAGHYMDSCRIRGRTLIVTNTDAHTASYQGPPFVYAIERVGTACGAASRQSLAAIGEGAFWMGNNTFHFFNGSSVQEVQCDVADYVFSDMNKQQISKVTGVHNSQFNEVWWFYPSGGSTENDRYVAYDYKENHWHFGSLDRTACVDRGVIGTPIYADSSGNVYNHELVGYPYSGALPFIESGPVSIGSGDTVMKVNNFIPDEKTQGDVNVTFKTRFYPNDTERSYGPYTMSNPTSVRFTGRQIRMRIETVAASDWRAGIMRVDAVAGGRR